MPVPPRRKDGKFDKDCFSAVVKSTEGYPEPPPDIVFPDEAIEKLKATSDHSEAVVRPTFHQKVMRSNSHKETYGPDLSLIKSEK